MEYTIFELERIERVLQEKRAAAAHAWNDRLYASRTEFKAEQVERNGRVSDMIFVGTAVGYAGEPVSGTLSAAWKKFQLENKDLALLKAEFDLFDRGLDLIRSHWDKSVEIFIANLREQTKPT